MSTILFDLDGTLTESGEGIIKSVQYALECVGRPEHDRQKLRVFIGPPLKEQFMHYTGMSLEEAERALACYRERFSTIGIYENRLYDGIEAMLRLLSEAGHVLAVASSKPEPFVERVLDWFNIRSYFIEVIGATMDEKRTHKAEVVEEALRRLGIGEDRSDVIMVGDKEHDVFGARAHGIPCAAVAYGYGGEDELTHAKPLHIAGSVDELTEFLLEWGVGA